VADLGILCQLDERRVSEDTPPVKGGLAINSSGNSSGRNSVKNFNLESYSSNNLEGIIDGQIVSIASPRAHDNASASVSPLIASPRIQGTGQGGGVIDIEKEKRSKRKASFPYEGKIDDDKFAVKDRIPLSAEKKPESPMPHTKTFVGTVTFMAPERIDGREYSYPSDVWAFGLSLMTLAVGSLPIDIKGGYWTILHCIRDEEPPTLPDDGRFSEEFKDFLSSCMQKNPSDRLTCNELLLHPFLRKALPEECGIGPNTMEHGHREDGHDDVETRGILELKSILSALRIHFERIQLGISPESGRENTESSSHGFFDKLKTSKLHDFICAFLFGDNSEVLKEETKENVGVPSSSFLDKDGDNQNYPQLSVLARQLFLTPEIIKKETMVYLHEIDRGLHKGKTKRSQSFAATPKAIHSYR
jgi:serine/threonine protein kinase